MPASFDCAAEDPVKWTHVQGVMADIYQLATDYGYAYSSPVSDGNRVWSVTTMPDPQTLAIYFTVADGVITDAYLVSALRTPDAWQPEPYMKELITRESLVVILEEDLCLCKTMWLVVPSAGGYTLKATSELPTGCCPTLKVPAAGDTLEAGPFIPSAAMRRKPRNITGMFDADTCRKGGASVVLYAEGRVVGVQREMRLKITWAIRKWQFDELEEEWHKLIYQTPGFAYQNPAEPGTLAVPGLFLCGAGITNNLTAGIIPAVPDGMAGCALAKMLKAWKEQYNPDLVFEAEWGSEPGCVELAAPTGRSSWLQPWNHATCGADSCDGRQRFYCNSIKWMNSMATMLRRFLCPRDTGAGFDWATQAVVTITHTNSPSVGVNVTVGTALVISGTKEATVVCGGGNSEFTGLAVRVSIAPVCGPRRFHVSITGDVHNADIYNQPGEECPDPYVPFEIWPGEAWLGPGNYFSNWRYRTGRLVEFCTDAFGGPGYCSTAAMDMTDGSPESPAVTPTKTLEVSFSEYNFAEINCTITITPLPN